MLKIFMAWVAHYFDKVKIFMIQNKQLFLNSEDFFFK